MNIIAIISRVVFHMRMIYIYVYGVIQIYAFKLMKRTHRVRYYDCFTKLIYRSDRF